MTTAAATHSAVQPARATVAQPGRWQFWIDRGGTFTDIVARRPDGRFETAKLLSENPERYQDAAIAGIRRFLNLPAEAPIPADAIEAVKMGTTVATNALLERKGDRTVLVITQGLGDALRIGYQNRPRLFDRAIRLPAPLYERVVEAPERLGPDGRVLTPLDLDTVRAGLKAAHDAGIRAVSIALMHGFAHPAHEQAIAKAAEEIGFTQISASHAVSPLIKLVGRGDTTVVDAYLSPVLRRYVDRVETALGGVKLQFMQSHGGLTAASLFRGKDAILSGPAGGVIGMVETCRAAGFERIIGFDMGGTSTDVSHYAGTLERDFDTMVAGVRMRAPMMAIHTVAAGGGSVLHFDGARFRVGPDSAGADPGPAAYRRGGPLAVTDCNVALGRVHPDFFPRIFGPEEDQPLDVEASRSGFRRIGAEAGLSMEDTAAGFLAIAVDNMANAIKKISVQRGHDVTKYTLACFGGAGGQHACLVADALGMTRVYIHPFAGVLSAFGMGLADARALRERSLERTLDAAALAEAETLAEAMAQEALAELAAQDVPANVASVERRALLRYRGSDTPFAVTLNTPEAMRTDFETAHHRQFGFIAPDKDLVLGALVVEAWGGGARPDADVLGEAPAKGATVAAHTRLYAEGAWRDAPVLRRSDIAVGEVVHGPALIVDPGSTTVVEPGWEASVTAIRDLIMTRTTPKRRARAIGTEADPILLEIFNNLFMSIAEQMGGVLANTAHSVNIKERLDFSCAVFDDQGNLVANAPHMPVHLGSMGESVRAVLRHWDGRMGPGDAFVLNDPYDGGTHLPDITVVTPVFLQDGTGKPAFFVASRGHHADIGGITPGSMPSSSSDIAEEGVLLRALRLVSAGRFDEAGIRAALAAGPHPARNPDENLADLKAQIAANARGQAELERIVAEFGAEVVLAYMRHVQDNAEESVRRVIGSLADSRFVLRADDGAEIAVSIAVDRQARAATIDFTGTSAQHPGNFNAPLAVTRAAVLYVFRTLVDDQIPMNEGCLKPLHLVVPAGSMLNPNPPAAVVAGNVETSQMVVDALYGALGVMGAAQGTMNNLTFGDATTQYYETICGGAGATPDADGASAVQTHMTNSRLTDPEILETRYPVILEEFSIRTGSGGDGAHRGGDGVVRRLRFERAMTAAILSNRRIVPPYGMAGGAPGATGHTIVLRADGQREELPACATVELAAGERIEIHTPGGGGYGAG